MGIPTLITEWVTRWELRYPGEKFVVKGAQHGANLKRLEKSLDRAELLLRMERYLSANDAWIVERRHDLDTFISQINKFGHIQPSKTKTDMSGLVAFSNAAAGREQFASALAALSESSERAISEMQAELYWDTLKAYDLDLVRKGIQHIIHTWKAGEGRKALPLPGDIRDVVSGMARRQSTIAPGPEPHKLLPGEIQERRKAEHADPAVRGAQAMLEAWRDRCEAVKNGLPKEDADRVIAELWRELMPRGREMDWRHYCNDCRDQGLVRFEDARGTTWHRPCTCQAGNPWRSRAVAFGAKNHPVQN